MDQTIMILDELAQFFKQKFEDDRANASTAALSSITCHHTKTEEYRDNARKYMIKKSCWEDVVNELNRTIMRIKEEIDVRNNQEL